MRFDCVTCKTALSKNSVDPHLKRKMHPDIVNGIIQLMVLTKDIIITKANGEIWPKTHYITEDPRKCYTNSNNITKDLQKNSLIHEVVTPIMIIQMKKIKQLLVIVRYVKLDILIIIVMKQLNLKKILNKGNL